MYDSLRVKGFRAFDTFEVPGLTRVNLLVGKNNAGKTCLLDAIEMAALGGRLASLLKSPIRRREFGPTFMEKNEVGWDVDLSHLFHGRQVGAGSSFEVGAATAASVYTVRCDVRTNQADRARLSLLEAQLGTDLPLEMVVTGSENADGNPGLPISLNGFLLGQMGLMRSFGEARPDLAVPPDLGVATGPMIVAVPPRQDQRRVLFLGTDGEQPALLRSIWDLLVGTAHEDQVIAAMQIIEPAIQRLVLTGQGSTTVAFVKLAGDERRIPLGSLGDGMKRLLAQALYMTLAGKGILLIDEIDTGLHYSAMESMWRFVIESARRLDVQVFATSHSGDCIRALAWLQTDAPELAADISVHRIDRTATAAVRYSAADIEIAARHHIEVRG